LTNINFRKTYSLDQAYWGIKERAIPLLEKYQKYPHLIRFKDRARNVTFYTERLIPTTPTGRPLVMLLFSNPHPNSVQQGMFLSPNTKGTENPFWSVMEDACWLPIPKRYRNPRQLADICLKAEYSGPFDFIFYCYYPFPTDFPEDIRKIFGRDYLHQCIEPEAITEFRKTIENTSIVAVLTFNKGIFNLVSQDKVNIYIECLKEGGLIQSQIKGIDKDIPVFLTFPTGWHYHSQYRQLRKASLETIKAAICSRLDVPDNRNA
jgi:hypothetical protein